MSALRPNKREKTAPKGSAAGIAPGKGPINGLIDPTLAAKYPVILSDALLGDTQKDVFTAVRYNHKPDLSSDSAPNLSRLKPSTPGDKTNFDLAFSDDGGKYGYAGKRSTDANQYVLYFDPDRKAFILDRVDSTFNMNLTRTPDNTDPESLREQFQHLDTSLAPKTSASLKGSAMARDGARKTLAKAAAKSTAKTSGPKQGSGATEAKSRKQPAAPEKKKKETKPIELALPRNVPNPEKQTAPPKEKSKPARRDEEEDEEEDDDDDDFGLTIEYPDQPAASRGGAGSSPAFRTGKVTMRRFSEFLRDSEADEADDADGESSRDEDRDTDQSNVPSPADAIGARQGGRYSDEEEVDDDDEDEYEDAGLRNRAVETHHHPTNIDRSGTMGQEINDAVDSEIDDDALEAELRVAFEQDARSHDLEESEVSEED